MNPATLTAWCHHPYTPWTTSSADHERTYDITIEAVVPQPPLTAEAFTKAHNERVQMLGISGWLAWRDVQEQAVREHIDHIHSRPPFTWDKAGRRDGQKRRVFCTADIFTLPPEEFDCLLALTEDTPNLEWLVFTATPERFESCLDAVANVNGVAVDIVGRWFNIPDEPPPGKVWPGTPPRNVCVGVIADTVEQAVARIPHLMKIPARVHFLLCSRRIRKAALEKLPTVQEQNLPGWPAHAQPLELAIPA